MITVKVVPHEEQRYPTAGDWQFDQKDHLEVRVSDLDDDFMNQLAAVHEIIEALLCRARGISQELVDAFDKENLDHPDPGSIPGCPYYREHMFASMLERALAAELQVDWDEYEFAVENLDYEEKA